MNMETTRQDDERGSPSAPQGGGVDGRAIAQARDAWQNSDEGRMLANDINGPVCGQYLRNRLEVAFCAGYEAALTAQPRTDMGNPISPRTGGNADRMAIKMLVAAGYVTEAKANEALNIAHGFDKGPLAKAQGGGEVVAITRHDAGFEPGPLFDPNGWDRLRALPKGTKLYTAPPSGPAGVEATNLIDALRRGISIYRDVKAPVMEITFGTAESIIRVLAQQPAAVDEVRIPRALADRVMTALGKFTSDEGWGMEDMQAADDFAAAIAGQQPAAVDETDTRRLDWLLWKLPGDAIRHCVGEIADTADGDEFRAAIDARIDALAGQQQGGAE